MSLGAFLSDKLKNNKKSSTIPDESTVYDFTARALDGTEIHLNRYRGKKLLIVNTASRCGKTPQYAQLQKLHEQYGKQVVILGFPANNFLWQEPDSNKEIAAFCERNYGVTFQMFEKISVKGSNRHPLYSWLHAKTGHKPDWNFAKYLVYEDGKTVKFFKSGVQPLDEPLLREILTAGSSHR
ncbi:MAG: glutathione peroxidase [Cyclobacteriaceae bacterium]|nr:MAG: glutathione peroxidase [Cyclobacteriaceae bacterium]